MKNTLCFALIVFVCFVLTSCNQLTRAKAEALIRTGVPLPSTSTEKVYWNYASDYYDLSPESKLLLNNLRATGLITYTETSTPRDGGWFGVINHIDRKVTLTTEGQKYLIKSDSGAYTVKLFDTDFDQITGMLDNTMHEPYTEVSFTVKRINITPFSRFLDKSPAPNITSNYAYIAKYDDGWRITRLGCSL